VRRGCLRAATGSQVTASVRALQPLSLAAATLATLSFMRLTQPRSHDEAQAHVRACFIYLAALLVELAAEPWYVLVTFRRQVVAESAIEVTARVLDAAAFWATLRVPAVRACICWLLCLLASCRCLACHMDTVIRRHETGLRSC
jgi:hypothetical protein